MTKFWSYFLAEADESYTSILRRGEIAISYFINKESAREFRKQFEKF